MQPRPQERDDGDKAMCTDSSDNLVKKAEEDTLCALITVPDTVVHFFGMPVTSQLFYKLGVIYQYSTNEKTGAQKT